MWKHSHVQHVRTKAEIRQLLKEYMKVDQPDELRVGSLGQLDPLDTAGRVACNACNACDAKLRHDTEAEVLTDMHYHNYSFCMCPPVELVFRELSMEYIQSERCFCWFHCNFCGIFDTLYGSRHFLVQAPH